MKKILFHILVLSIVSCGDGGEKTSTTEVVEGKQSRLLTGKLRNTSWEMPGYPDGNISFENDLGTVSMSATSFISNGTISVLEEDPQADFVVVNIYNTNGNRVVGISVEDNNNIKVSVITSSNSLEGYKSTHDSMGVLMQKK